MVVKLEKEDLAVRLNFAYVCSGSQQDYVDLREVLRNTEGVKVIFFQNCAEFLYILKEHELTDIQRKRFEEKRAKKNIGVK